MPAFTANVDQTYDTQMPFPSPGLQIIQLHCSSAVLATRRLLAALQLGLCRCRRHQRLKTNRTTIRQSARAFGCQ